MSRAREEKQNPLPAFQQQFLTTSLHLCGAADLHQLREDLHKSFSTFSIQVLKEHEDIHEAIRIQESYQLSIFITNQLIGLKESL